MKKTSKFLGFALAATTAVGATATAAAQTTITFKIPAGPIESIISEFQRLTGLKVILSDAGNRQASRPPALQALSRSSRRVDALLAGTKINATFGPKTLTLDVSQMTYQVNVAGETMLASPKYRDALRDTPQDDRRHPADSLCEEQSATTLRDVLRNTPGITMSIGEGGSGTATSSGDNIFIRGFNAATTSTSTAPAISGVVTATRSTSNRLKWRRGRRRSPAAAASTGGSINLVTKAATPYRLGERPSHRRQRRSQARHASTSITASASSAAFRLNGMWQDAGYPGRDVAEVQEPGALRRRSASASARRRRSR